MARAEPNCDLLRFSSDLTDRDWAVVAPLIPLPKRGGRPRTTDLHDVGESILLIALSVCPWRMLPCEFSADFDRARLSLRLARQRPAGDDEPAFLVMAAREIACKQAQLTAGIIDSQSVKTTESGRIRDYDAGKKIKGRKRHFVTDTLGLLIFVLIHGADIKDREGAPGLLTAVRFDHPWLRHIFARWRLCHQQTEGCEDRPRSLDHRDRRARRRGIGLRRPASPLGRRAADLARTLLPPRQGLGTIHRKRHCIRPHRQHPHAHAPHRKTLPTRMNF